MPRLIDYGVRFELIREAVVRVAAREGGAGVTIGSVAAELKVSGSTLRRTIDSSAVLPGLGVAWIDRMRQYPRFQLGKTLERGTAERVIRTIRRELPIDDEELERERAWLALTGIGASGRCRESRDAHHAYLEGLSTLVVEQLVPDEARREFEATRLSALVDGLVAAACRGGISLEQMHATFDRHMAELVEQQAGSPDRPVSPGAA
jgi:AcrR family transcriptional regulator